MGVTLEAFKKAKDQLASMGVHYPSYDDSQSEEQFRTHVIQYVKAQIKIAYQLMDQNPGGDLCNSDL